MKIIGHRGARGLAPENTIASLRKALEHHVDMVEFDLRVTGDKVVILHHNPVLVDAAGQRFRINRHRYDELKEHKPDLARFEDALDAIDHMVPVYLEVKPGEPVKPITNIIRQRLAADWRPEHFLLGSKKQKTLLQFHAALPDIEKIVIEPWSGVRATRRARAVGTRRLSMNKLWLWWGFIKAMRRGGWELYAYTLNDPAKARRWSRYGLAGIVTDYPDRFTK